MSTEAPGPQAQVLLGPGPCGPAGLPSGVSHDPYLTTNQRKETQREKEREKEEKERKRLHVVFRLRIQIV